MNDVLQQVYFDNTLQNYLVVLGVIIAAVIFKKFIARYIAGLIFQLISRRYKTIDKTSFKNLIARPLSLFIVVLIIVVALDRLKYPSILDFTIYHLKLRDLLQMVATALLIITFFRFVIKCIDFIVLIIKGKYITSGDPADHQLFFFFKDFLKIIIGALGVLLILKYSFHYDVKGLVTGLSIVGAAVALALKESLENLIASFVIFFDKPFETGDAVKLNNFSGVVEKIGLRSTRIRSDAKTYITVPNKQMVDSVLDNLSNRTQRRADLKLEIDADTPPATVQKLLQGLKTVFTKTEILSFNLFLSDISSNSIVITCDYYTTPDNIQLFNTIREQVNLEALQLLESLNIELAGKSTDVKIVDTAGQAPKKSDI